MTTGERPRIVLADDHQMFVEAFCELLQPRFEVVGTFGDGRAVVRAADDLRPDVAVLDIAMPRLNGLDATELLLERLPAVKVVILTMDDDPDIAAEAARRGASGYVIKSAAVSELFEAIETVLAGKRYVSPALSTQATWRAAPRQNHGLSALTSRQREVLQLLAEGSSMKEAASALCLTPRTIAFHKYRIMEGLGIKTSAELVQFAIKSGLIRI